jgi:hypothetical protein
MLESVGGKLDLGLEDELDFVLCDRLVMIDLAVGNVFVTVTEKQPCFLTMNSENFLTNTGHLKDSQ